MKSGRLTILECRPPWDDQIGPEWTRAPFARLSYVKMRNEWSLFWVDRNDRFHRYPDCAATRYVSDLLAEIDADPTTEVTGSLRAENPRLDPALPTIQWWIFTKVCLSAGEFRPVLRRVNHHPLRRSRLHDALIPHAS